MSSAECETLRKPGAEGQLAKRVLDVRIVMTMVN